MRENDNRFDKLLKEFDRLTLVLAGVLVLVLAIFYFGIKMWAPSSVWGEFVTSLIIEFIPVFVAFFVSYLLLRRVQLLREENHQSAISDSVVNSLKPLLEEINECIIFERFNVIPWDQYIKDATQIDITVHYFDTWLNSHPDAIRHFFSKKGTVLNIILPNPEKKDLLSSILSRFPDMQHADLERKINNTALRLNERRGEVKASKSSLNVYQINHMQWYCAVRFNKQKTIISVYENARRGGTEAPAFVIDHAKYPLFETWIKREFDGLIQSAEKLDLT